MADDETPSFEARATPGRRTEGRLRWPSGQARCVFGRGGLISAEDKREGDGATPRGVWAMRCALFRPDRMAAPATGLASTALSPDMGWCDDPGHADYNRLVRLPFPASHEKLWRKDAVYDVIVALGYNDDPVLAGRGSAIFLHVARPDFSPTEGCVACARADLLAMLAAAKAGDRLKIAG